MGVRRAASNSVCAGRAWFIIQSLVLAPCMPSATNHRQACLHQSRTGRKFHWHLIFGITLPPPLQLAYCRAKLPNGAPGRPCPRAIPYFLYIGAPRASLPPRHTVLPVHRRSRALLPPRHTVLPVHKKAGTVPGLLERGPLRLLPRHGPWRLQSSPHWRPRPLQPGDSWRGPQRLNCRRWAWFRRRPRQ